MAPNLRRLRQTAIIIFFIFDVIFVAAVPYAVTSSGVIQGTEHVCSQGLSYFAFRGIPYARPPVGNLRWKLPETLPPFDSVYEAVDFKAGCPQAPGTHPGPFDEDCLYLDVYVPHNVTTLFRNVTEAVHAWESGDGTTLSSSASSSGGDLPVMIWIHGGAYHAGTSKEYEGGKLATEQGVVVVVVQYRLGALGFLSTGDSTLPGNFGLWDQRLAMQWVKDHIRGFGGDDAMVTLAGQSAGAASVSQHTLSRHSSGLFRRAVMMSGAAEATWCFNHNPGAAFDALSVHAGCGSSKNSQMSRLSCMMSKSFSDIQTASVLTENGNFVTFVPNVDGVFFHDKVENLLEDHAYLRSVGFYDRDVLVGTLNNEGVVMFSTLLPFASATGQIPYAVLDNAILGAFMAQELGDGYSLDVQDVVNNQYFYPRYPAQVSFPLQQAFQVYSDSSFIVPAVKYVRHHSGSSSSSLSSAVSSETSSRSSRSSAISARPSNATMSGRSFLYYFDWLPSMTKGSIFQGMPHELDVDYLFGFTNSTLTLYGAIPLPGTILPVEYDVSRRYGDMIGAFVRTGDPNNGISTSILKELWLPYDANNETFLRFSLTPSVDSHLCANKVSFWIDLVPRLQSRWLHHMHNSAVNNASSAAANTLTYFDMSENDINILLISLIVLCAVLLLTVACLLHVCCKVHRKQNVRNYEMGKMNDGFHDGSDKN